MDTSPPQARIALAGGYVLDLAGHALRDSAGRPVELRPQAFDVLRMLVEHRGELVTKEALFSRVWPGLVVTDDSLVQAVGDIRRALGEAGRGLVRTVPRRDYLLEADSPSTAASGSMAGSDATGADIRSAVDAAAAQAGVANVCLAIAGASVGERHAETGWKRATTRVQSLAERVVKQNR